MSKRANKANEPHDSKSAGRGVLQTIREIKQGSLDPKQLSPEDRRACVGHVIAEGLTVVETAQLFKVADRTITRDRKALEEDGAIDRDPRLAGVVAGRLIAEADLCMQRIRRATREKGAPHAVRVEGERVCFAIFSDLAQRLQSLGYLPTAAQELTGTISHTLDDIPSFEETEREIKHMRRAIDRNGGGDSEEWIRLLELHKTLHQSKIDWGVGNLREQIERKRNERNKKQLPSSDPG